MSPELNAPPSYGTDAPIEPLLIYTETEHLDQLRDRIAGTMSGDRVAYMTMGFDPTEPKVGAIVDETVKAASRNVNIFAGIDAYSFLLDDKNNRFGPLFTRGSLDGRISSPFLERLEALKLINSYPSATVGVINQPGRPLTNPVAGRSHIKASVVNDWWDLGGCNMLFTDKVDLMVGNESNRTATWLYRTMGAIVTAQTTKDALRGLDRTFQVDPITEINIDAGIPNQSRILEKSHALIQAADKWALISGQYFPNGSTGHHLAEASDDRNVIAQALYNQPANNGLVSSLWQRATIAVERRRLPHALFEGQLPADAPILHAKTLSTENGGSIGSHNNIDTGVRLGTPEMTLIRHDPEFAVLTARTILRRFDLLDDPRYAHIAA